MSGKTNESGVPPCSNQECPCHAWDAVPGKATCSKCGCETPVIRDLMGEVKRLTEDFRRAHLFIVNASACWNHGAECRCGLSRALFERYFAETATPPKGGP